MCGRSEAVAGAERTVAEQVRQAHRAVVCVRAGEDERERRAERTRTTTSLPVTRGACEYLHWTSDSIIRFMAARATAGKRSLPPSPPRVRLLAGHLALHQLLAVLAKLDILVAL